MSSIGKLMKQAARMQQQMEQVQAQLAARTVEATSGGGAVKVTAKCDGSIASIKIDPQALNIQQFQNGQLRQNSNTRHLIFNCHQLVSFISTNLTLLPGDIILTGTPAGVGPIQSGDRLEVRIQGLAPLVNQVK